MNWVTTFRDILRKRDHDTSIAIVRLLRMFGAFCELCSSDEIAKSLENKREPEIRKILLQRWKEIQIKHGVTKL